MSGYDLKRTVEGSISNFWSESYGQIYPILRQLEEDGLATCQREETRGGRPRHVYAITQRGREELSSWLAAPTPSVGVRHEQLLKLFFGTQTDPETNIARVEAYRAEQVAERVHYAEIDERLRAAKGAPVDLEYWLMTLRYGQIEVRGRIEWCDETLARLRALATPPPSRETKT
jgi:PadR family transcriptional regulator AphA